MGNKSTVFLDQPLWQMFQANVVTQAQAIRLQQLSDAMKEGRCPVKLSPRDKQLLSKYQLFHASPASPLKH